MLIDLVCSYFLVAAFAINMYLQRWQSTFEQCNSRVRLTNGTAIGASAMMRLDTDLLTLGYSDLHLRISARHHPLLCPVQSGSARHGSSCLSVGSDSMAAAPVSGPWLMSYAGRDPDRDSHPNKAKSALVCSWPGSMHPGHG